MAQKADQTFISDLGTIQAFLLSQSLAGFGFRAPIYQAAIAQELDLAETTAGGVVALEAFTHTRPLLVVLGDDGPAPTGPEGFAQTARLLRWTRAVILYTAGGEERFYRQAVDITTQHGRCVLIEADSGQRQAWMRAVEAEMFDRHELGLKQLAAVDIRAEGEAPPGGEGWA
jgi:hypothetical protein